MNEKNKDNYQRKKSSVGIYCRLSNDDKEHALSNSIENQKTMLIKYAANKDWAIYDVYIDDGYTGTNFERPEFKRLLRDIEAQRLEIVLTKDMSRLGRDYIQVGYYVEKYFPEKGIRYIAVNDHVDTGTDTNENEIMPFKAIINDMYAKDISKKIRSVFDVKREEGKFIGSFAPYGYKKDPDNKNHLIIDWEVHAIVKRIFHMYLSGKGLKVIARTLNEENILPPAAYKAQNIRTYHHPRMKTPKWGHSAVRHILTNPTYTGDMAQRKSQKINYKSTKVKRLRPEEWLVVQKTHEAIISKEDFERVRTLMHQRNKNRDSVKKKIRFFNGFVFCGECGAPMTNYKAPNEVDFLICSTYKKYGKITCTRHAIRVDRLEEMVLKDVNDLIKDFTDTNVLTLKAKEILEAQDQKRKKHRQEIEYITRKIEEYTQVFKSLYIDKAKQLIKEEQFWELYQTLCEEKKDLLHRKEVITIKLKESTEEEDDRKIKAWITEVQSLNKLNKWILLEILDKIEILEKHEIKIHYRFRNPYGKNVPMGIQLDLDGNPLPLR
ncbi:recombinase family protein [Clostridiaceae bacterium 35-E11]